jgi:hypothetical protein
MIIDSDTVFLQDFTPVTIVPASPAGQPCKIKFKYNLSTRTSGAYNDDIVNPRYHKFVEYMTGLPKPMKMEVTAINHWQIMQRDVMHAMARSIKARLGFDNITAAMIAYLVGEDKLSEYETYFSFAWYFYQEHMDLVNMP